MFGRGARRIVGRNFGCGGTQTRLSSCSYTTISLSSYTSYQSNTPAGVICQGNTLSSTECNRGDVRLVSGSGETEGRVEVCAYGYWAIVCDGHWPNAWDIGKTRLLCKQLGLPTESKHPWHTLSMEMILLISLCIQHLGTCLTVHLDLIISCLLLDFPVVVGPVMSVNAK